MLKQEQFFFQTLSVSVSLSADASFWYAVVGEEPEGKDLDGIWIFHFINNLLI